jgi:hypothetical protein
MRALAVAAVLLVPASASATPWRSFEWTYLTSAGYTPRAAVLGIGAEGSLPVLRWHGFPSGYSGSHALGELRVGAFAFGASRLGAGLVEGGALADVSSLYHASWGTFTARIGGGVGFADHPHGVATLLYGVRSVLGRYGNSGVPRWWGEASIARLFVTHRRAVRGDGYEWVFGIELSPTFFLPPITWWRLAGGPPH